MIKRFRIVYEQMFNGNLGPEYTGSNLETQYFETLKEAQVEFAKFESTEEIDKGQSNVKHSYTNIATLYDGEEQIDAK